MPLLLHTPTIAILLFTFIHDFLLTFYNSYNLTFLPFTAPFIPYFHWPAPTFAHFYLTAPLLPSCHYSHAFLPPGRRLPPASLPTLAACILPVAHYFMYAFLVSFPSSWLWLAAASHASLENSPHLPLPTTHCPTFLFRLAEVLVTLTNALACHGHKLLDRRDKPRSCHLSTVCFPFTYVCARRLVGRANLNTRFFFLALLPKHAPAATDLGWRVVSLCGLRTARRVWVPAARTAGPWFRFVPADLKDVGVLARRPTAPRALLRPATLHLTPGLVFSLPLPARWTHTRHRVCRNSAFVHVSLFSNTATSLLALAPRSDASSSFTTPRMVAQVLRNSLHFIFFAGHTRVSRHTHPTRATASRTTLRG